MSIHCEDFLPNGAKSLAWHDLCSVAQIAQEQQKTFPTRSFMDFLLSSAKLDLSTIDLVATSEYNKNIRVEKMERDSVEVVADKVLLDLAREIDNLQGKISALNLFPAAIRLTSALRNAVACFTSAWFSNTDVDINFRRLRQLAQDAYAQLEAAADRSKIGQSKISEFAKAARERCEMISVLLDERQTIWEKREKLLVMVRSALDPAWQQL